MWAKKHIEECSEKFNPEDNGRTYVVCAICGYHGKSLGKHISDVHGIAPREYEKKYEVMISCSAARKNYSEQNKYNCDWIKRAKENGDDLVEYKQKMGAAVSKAIMSNPDECARRARVMARNNQTERARQKSSETAIITSARPNIQRERAERLRIWRDENPDEFYEKCISKMHASFQSKPEQLLFELVLNCAEYDFRRSQIIKSDTFTWKSQRKQIDIADKKARVYIEFDGKMHFEKCMNDEEGFKKVQDRDCMLDNHILKHAWTLIRVSYDQFTYKRSGQFSMKALQKLFDLLSNPQPGVHCIGDSYGERNLLNANSKNFNNSICL